MSQLYDIYQSDTFELARSLVIKMDLVADAINRELMFKGYPIAPDSPHSYKYFLNLAGEYHISDHDSLKQEYGSNHIMVDIATNSGYKSVPFTKDLFHGDDADRSLLNEYQLGSHFYKRLVGKYPQYESLIRGILSPLDIDDVIAAPNGTIMSIAYRQRRVRDNGQVYYEVPLSVKGTKTVKLIETQEHNLIDELQDWVSKSLYRWVVDGYSLTDDLYVPFIVGVLSAAIPAKIMNIRWGNVHTGYAHTFHIKEYLTSHGMLGKYVQFIPLKQIMYLYRNVRYLELNLGKSETFYEIIGNMLTPTYVPLAGYYFKHDISKMRGDSGRLLPEGRMMREHLNFKSLGAGSDRRDIRELLEREIPLGRENGRFIDEVEQDIRQKVRWSGDDELIVKVLESELTDITDPVPVTLASQLVWFWAYTSARGWYKGNIFVSNPVNGERIALSALNAFILMLYCINISGRQNYLEFIPNEIVTAHWITKSDDPTWLPKDGGYKTMPSLDEMKSQIEKGALSDEYLAKFMGDFKGRYASSGSLDFFNMVKAHHDELSRKFFEMCRIEEAMSHGYAEHVWFHSYWQDVPVALTQEPVRYDEWLPKLGIDFNHFNKMDYDALALDLITECTGLSNITDINRVELQRSMIEILKHFTSYTTHYLYSVNEGAITNTSGKHIRVSDLSIDGELSLAEGIYIGQDMFNDRVDANMKQSVPINSNNVVDLGINDVAMRQELPNGFKIDAIDIMYNSMMPMHRLELLSARLHYSTEAVFDIPIPPASIVLYALEDYVSTPYIIFDTQALLVAGVDVTGSASDEPVLIDTVQTGQLTGVAASLVHAQDLRDTYYEDELTAGGLSRVDITMESVTRESQLATSDSLSIGRLANISGEFVRSDFNHIKDSVTHDIELVTGDTTDARVIAIADGLEAVVATITSTSQETPAPVAPLVNTEVVVDGFVFDEPDLIEDAVIVTENVTGEMVDDRRDTLVDNVIIGIGGVTGSVNTPVDFDGGISSAAISDIDVTGRMVDGIGAWVVSSATAQVTKVTGSSNDFVMPKLFRDKLGFSSISVTGFASDLEEMSVRDDATLTPLYVSGDSKDDHFSNTTDKALVSVTAISGDSFDDAYTTYSDAQEIHVTDVSGDCVDVVYTNYSSSLDHQVTGVTGELHEDASYPVRDNLTSKVTGISADVMDWIDHNGVHNFDIGIEAITGEVSDDSVIAITDAIEINVDTVTGGVYNLTSFASPTTKAVINISSISGVMYDEPTVEQQDTVTTSVTKVTGRAQDDRQVARDDGFWHRVSNVTGEAVDDRRFEMIEKLRIEAIVVTGNLYTPLVNSYGSQVEARITQINGGMVQPQTEYGDNLTPTIDVDVEVYDEVSKSYVDKGWSITSITVSGHSQDPVTKPFALNHEITIVSITGDITDEQPEP